MKRFAKVLVIFLALGWTTACTVNTNPPTPPVIGAGYVDQYDQHFAQVIRAATKFYNDIQNDVNARTYVPGPTELKALNDFGAGLNAAKLTAAAYKSSQTPANLTAAQNATNSLQTQQNALAAQIPGGK